MNETAADSTLARVFKHESLFWTCGSDIERRDGWIAFYNSRFPTRYDPNHAGEFRGAPGTGARIALDLIEFYRARALTPIAYVDSLSTPTDLIAELRRAGFVENDDSLANLLLWQGPDTGLPSDADVQLAATESDKRAWASITAEYLDRDEQAQAQLEEYYFTQIQDPRVTPYLARVDGEPAARCLLFSADGIGRVEVVRTLTRFQRRGLASAVVRRAVADSRRANELTYLFAEPDGEAQRLYERLGFRVAAQKRNPRLYV